MNFTPFRKYLHKVARILENISPMKGELVDIRFIKTDERVRYKYKKVRDEGPRPERPTDFFSRS